MEVMNFKKIESSYNNFGIESTIVICKSNKRHIYIINKFDIKYYGKKNEYLYRFFNVVRNNYSQLEDESKLGLLLMET